MRLTKTYLYDICVGNFYNFHIYKITDAHKQIWYTASPVTHGGTRSADSIEELRKELEKQVEPLNRFLQKTR